MPPKRPESAEKKLLEKEDDPMSESEVEEEEEEEEIDEEEESDDVLASIATDLVEALHTEEGESITTVMNRMAEELRNIRKVIMKMNTSTTETRKTK